MGYRVEIAPGALRQLKKLDPQVRARIGELIERIESLADPRSIGEALKGDKFGQYWKYRAGDWRVRAAIYDQILVIEVIEIDHRSRIYR